MTFTLSASLLMAVVLSASATGGLTHWHLRQDATFKALNGTPEHPVHTTEALAPQRSAASTDASTESNWTNSGSITSLASVASGLALVALLFSMWLARQWVRPLRALQKTAQRIACGDLAARVTTDRDNEIGELAKDVNRMAERLERMEGTRKRWMADLVHELRTPLTTLNAHMDGLISASQPLSIEAMSAFREETLRLQAVVEDLQLLATNEPQVPACHFAVFDAANLVERVLQRQQRAAKEAGLTLGWAKRRPKPLTVCWDATRIERVLNNLIQNSLHFSDAPGRIEVGLQSTAHCVQMTVEDSAPGVEAWEASLIFEPLYQVDSTRGRNPPGRGLGLAVCAAIVHAHGGLISAHPSNMGGLRIEIDLPIQPEKAT